MTATLHAMLRRLAILVFPLALLAALPCAAGDESRLPLSGSDQAYYDKIFGGSFYETHANFILAKVIEVAKEPPEGDEAAYVLEAVADYRNEVKEHDRLIVGGDLMHPGSNISPMAKLPIGKTVILAAVPGKQRGTYHTGSGQLAPFGFAAPTVIQPAELNDVKEALAEMRRVVPLDGHGPVPRDQVDRLLKSTNYAIWALGASLRACQATQKDVDELELIAVDKAATVAQLAWVHHLVLEVVPDKVQPSCETLNWMFSSFLNSHTPNLQALEPGPIE